MIMPITIYFVVVNFRDLKGDEDKTQEDSGMVANPLNGDGDDNDTVEEEGE